MSSETETTTSPGGAGAAPDERGSRPTETLPPARVPRGAARAGWLGVLLAAVLLGVGVLAAYDATALLGWADVDPVATPVVDTEVALRPDTATTVLGAVLALIGLWLVWTSVKRSPRRGARLATATGAWMSYGDLERLAAGTAEDVHGVLAAHVSGSPRRLRVDVQTTAPEVHEHVQRAVTERLSALQSPPRVTVAGGSPRDPGGEGR